MPKKMRKLNVTEDLWAKVVAIADTLGIDPSEVAARALEQGLAMPPFSDALDFVNTVDNQTIINHAISVTALAKRNKALHRQNNRADDEYQPLPGQLSPQDLVRKKREREAGLGITWLPTPR